MQRHDGKPDSLGLTVLDEPCAKQSDPTVLDLMMRNVTKQSNMSKIVSLEPMDRQCIVILQVPLTVGTNQ